MLDLPKWFYSLKNIFLCPTYGYSLKMRKFTIVEFIMILELLEIYILHLCLVLNLIA
jgi:hypothetical protein